LLLFPGVELLQLPVHLLLWFAAVSAAAVSAAVVDAATAFAAPVVATAATITAAAAVAAAVGAAAVGATAVALERKLGWRWDALLSSQSARLCLSFSNLLQPYIS
jgi:hypothetical protein